MRLGTCWEHGGRCGLKADPVAIHRGEYSDFPGILGGNPMPFARPNLPALIATAKASFTARLPIPIP